MTCVLDVVSSQLFVVDNCIDDWRIALSVRRVLQLSLELLVCSVHPPPGAFYFHWRPVYEHPPQDHPDLDLDFLDPDLNPDTDIDFVFYLDLDLNLEPDPDPDLDLEDDDEDHPPGASRLVPIDALLALPMFFRLYLVCR